MHLDPNQIDPPPNRLESITLGRGGWVCARYDGGALLAYARFGTAGSRLELTEQYLRRKDGGTLRARDRQMVEWGRLVRICNLDGWLRETIRQMSRHPGPDLARAAAAMNTTYGDEEDHWVANMFRAQIGKAEQARWPDRKGLGAKAIRPSHRGRPETVADPWKVAAPAALLDVPSTSPYPDEFWRQVADVVESLIAAGYAPNSTMAVVNGKPKTTIDRWVRRATEKGFLAPRRRGNPIEVR